MLTSSLSGLRILLVEDEPLLAWELELALAAAGAIVIGPASTLRSGFRLALEDGIAAAVLDCRLGNEESGPLAEWLYEREIPFLIHTGHGKPGNAAWGSAPVVRKPANPDRIVQVLASLVHHRTEPLREAALMSDRSG